MPGELTSGSWQVVTHPTPLPERIRRVSVNPFGFGGTNAHVVIGDSASHPKSPQLSNGDVNGYFLDPHGEKDTSSHGSGVNGLSNGDLNGCSFDSHGESCHGNRINGLSNADLNGYVLVSHGEKDTSSHSERVNGLPNGDGVPRKDSLSRRHGANMRVLDVVQQR